MSFQLQQAANVCIVLWSRAKLEAAKLSEMGATLKQHSKAHVEYVECICGVWSDVMHMQPPRMLLLTKLRNTVTKA